MTKEYVAITLIIGFVTHAMLSMMQTINFYKIKNESWYCIPCTKEIFAFCHIEEKKTIISKSLSEPSPSLVKLINQLNNFTEETRIKTSTKTLDNSRFRNIHKEKEYSFFQIYQM